jgi:cation transport regulator ChaB
MPYQGISDSKLPSYVQKLPEKLRKGWVAVFNGAYDKYGEKKAFLMANAWVKKQMPEKKKGFVKRSAIEFEVYTKQGFIKRSADGEDYITFVLNSTKPHRDGKMFSEKMLMAWADYINKNPNLVGDVDHLLYDRILNSGMSEDSVRNVLKGKKGIAKAVQAIYQDGKLWVKAAIDKRYKKLVEKSRGVSAEAFCEWEDDTAVDGELLGFSFNVKTTPADYLAGVKA